MKFNALRLLFVAAGIAACGVPRSEAATPSLPGQITVLTIIDVVPDCTMAKNIEQEAALLKQLAADSRHAPGNVHFNVYGDTTRPNHFIMLSVWKNMHAFDDYSGAAATRKFRATFQPGMDGPFDERIYADLNYATVTAPSNSRRAA